MNKKEQEMRELAREEILEVLQGGYDGYYCDLHNEVFNATITLLEHIKLKSTGGIRRIQRYRKSTDIRKDNFGEVYTDLSDRKN